MTCDDQRSTPPVIPPFSGQLRFHLGRCAIYRRYPASVPLQRERGSSGTANPHQWTSCTTTVCFRETPTRAFSARPIPHQCRAAAFDAPSLSRHRRCTEKRNPGLQPAASSEGATLPALLKFRPVAGAVVRPCATSTTVLSPGSQPELR